MKRLIIPLSIRLEGGGGQVGVRIQSATWQTLTEEDKAQFEKGKMATAEGILVLTGEGALFVVLGVIPTPAATYTPTPVPSPTPAPLHAWVETDINLSSNIY